MFHGKHSNVDFTFDVTGVVKDTANLSSGVPSMKKYWVLRRSTSRSKVLPTRRRRWDGDGTRLDDV
ncbi:hypothetical protein O9993_18025 [Vibrio lentus]|nr:hypothetical protein [Vibrio lentus]